MATPLGTVQAETRRNGLRLRTHDRHERWRYLIDRAMAGALILASAVGVAVLLLILACVTVKGAPALSPAFFTERPLPYGEAGGGIAPAILGTLEMLAVGAVFGVGLGVAAGIYLAEFGGGRLAAAISFAIDLMAGLPSIVVGVFVWALLVRHVVGQYSGLAGSVALGLVMVPIVARTVQEMLRLVPDSLREASLALGVPRWRTILQVVLPTARAGILTGVVLALARAGGETAPLLLTALGNQFFNFDLLQPMASLPVQMYTYAVSPYEDWHTKAWGGALVLVATIGSLSLVARLATNRRQLR